MADLLQSAALFTLVVGTALLAALESRIPLRVVDGRARHGLRNGAVALLVLVTGGVTGGALYSLAVWTRHSEVGWLAQTRLPEPLALVIGVLALDFGEYLRHRLSHGWPPLWALHRVHHSDEAMDVTTALRNHPLELLWASVSQALVLLLVGPPALALAVRNLLLMAALVFQHANVTLPPWLDALLRWITPTPAMHSVHHSPLRHETDSNFSIIFSLWDRLGRTYAAAAPPPRTGLDSSDERLSVWGMLREPFVRDGATVRPPAQTRS